MRKKLTKKKTTKQTKQRKTKKANSPHMMAQIQSFELVRKITMNYGQSCVHFVKATFFHLAPFQNLRVKQKKNDPIQNLYKTCNMKVL